jgi:hypothetical protein
MEEHSSGPKFVFCTDLPESPELPCDSPPSEITESFLGQSWEDFDRIQAVLFQPTVDLFEAMARRLDRLVEAAEHSIREEERMEQEWAEQEQLYDALEVDVRVIDNQLANILSKGYNASARAGADDDLQPPRSNHPEHLHQLPGQLVPRTLRQLREISGEALEDALAYYGLGTTGTLNERRNRLGLAYGLIANLYD